MKAELVRGPKDGQIIDLGDQEPAVVQMVHIWVYAQDNEILADSDNILVEYHKGIDGRYYYFGQQKIGPKQD
jgi:hypothetical protein